ncbi:MAG: signal peptide peptidase SppA [Deltaproteobacteria bacterium]|jgi:protease-4|nr:signal peptide peptidase SppA [Deltaproteobacteria bacterium]
MAIDDLDGSAGAASDVSLPRPEDTVQSSGRDVGVGDSPDAGSDAPNPINRGQADNRPGLGPNQVSSSPNSAPAPGSASASASASASGSAASTAAAAGSSQTPFPKKPTPRYIAPAADKPKPQKSSWLSWPAVFLILGFFVIGSCNYTMMEVVNQFNAPSALDTLDKPGLGVILIEGEIFDTTWASETLKEFEDNEFIKAVVLRIDSPGGAVVPCQELYTSLVGFTKPVVVSMGTVAASGGLYLAMGGDAVLASPGTVTGSIGVIMEAMEFTDTMDKLGIKSEVIKSGTYKDIGSPFRAMKPDEREILQSVVMKLYEQFVGDVVKGRPKLTEPQVRLLADGRIFSGEEAFSLGLVDQLGGFEQAIAKAKELGEIPDDEKVPIVYDDGREDDWLSYLAGRASFFDSVQSAIKPGFSLKFIYRPGIF